MVLSVSNECCLWHQTLEWAYTAEVVAILFVQFVVACFARKRVQTMVDGWLILSLYPISLVMVIVLENVLHLD